MLVDFRSLDIEHVPLPTGVAVVVMDTGARRSLMNSDYNERRAACERAVAGLQQIGADVRSLRDATSGMLDAAAALMDEVALDCARHVVAENTRPATLRDALLSGDFAAAGAVMDESHRSLRDLFRVSSSHLDIAWDVARAQSSCYGARMTGAGFGGCAIALVRADAVAGFIDRALPGYESRTYKRGEFYVASADDGARLDLARFQ
jgi:galactokinase